MPDGDRFERKLRGKGWKSVYRLGCAGAPTQAVVDKVMRAAAHFFRTELTDSLRDVCGELLKAVASRQVPLFESSAGGPLVGQLSRSLEEVKRDYGYSETCRLAEKAALQTLGEIERLRQEPNETTVTQIFMSNFVADLCERRCLSPVRDGIMQASGRDAPAQQKWEVTLRELIFEPCAALSHSVLDEDGNRPIRAPNRRFKPTPMTAEALNQPLPVIGEPR